MMRFGRFTASGGSEVESSIARVVAEGGRIAASTLPAASYRALALMGGYGRGEGGVETVDGVERPHNNLDFLLVTAGASRARTEALRTTLGSALAPLAERERIGIDVGAISDTALRRAPCRVMWYDVRFGHQTILGDDTFLPCLGRFVQERIEAADIRNLVVNRGTLLVIDDAVVASGTPRPEVRKALLRHAVKAILGYGDALLYWRGVYHWSYGERQRRMAGRNDVGEDFKALYDSAMRFRFRPDYAAWEGRDIPAWLEEVRRAVEPVHLQVEARRCGREGLTWSEYPGAAFRQARRDGMRTPREAARMLRALIAPGRSGTGRGTGSQIPGFVPPRDLLGIVFPVIAYRLADPGFRALARAAVDGPDDDDGLRLAFLRSWGRHGDPNFEHAARKLGLRLREGTA